MKYFLEKYMYNFNYRQIKLTEKKIEKYIIIIKYLRYSQNIPYGLRLIQNISLLNSQKSNNLPMSETHKLRINNERKESPEKLLNI